MNKVNIVIKKDKSFEERYKELIYINNLLIIELANKKFDIHGYYSTSNDDIYFLWEDIAFFIMYCMETSSINNCIMNRIDSHREISKKSLCMVTNENDDIGITLLRLADINDKNEIVDYEIKDNIPKAFENRLWLFKTDGPTEIGFIGVWDWKAIPNKNDVTKDYIETHYSTYDKPIEIIEIDSVNSKESLIEKLKTGIDIELSCDKTMLCYRININNYVGILCDRDDLILKNKNYYIDEDVIYMPIYNFTEFDIYRYREKMFCKNLNIIPSDDKVYFKDKNSIIKEVILKKASWSVIKPYNISRKEWQAFREFFNDISDKNLYSEISEYLDCSEIDAQRYVEEFIDSADKNIEKGDISDNILLRLIENNSELRREFEENVEHKWENEHQEKINDLNSEVDELEKKIILKNGEKEILEQEIQKFINESKNQIEELKKNIDKYKCLEKNVQVQVNDKLEDISNNMAIFIRDIMYSTQINKFFNNDDIPGESLFELGKEFDCDEIIEDWEEAIDSLECELDEAGIASDKKYSFATFMYSAYCNKQPILLAGPYGKSIAEAFSIALFGRRASVLDCSAKYQHKVIDEIINSDAEVIIITKYINSEWFDKVIELITMSDKFYILITDFAEDLLLEPKGILNYVIPVLTELLVDSIPTNNFIGCKKSSVYEEYIPLDKIEIYSSWARELNISMLARNRRQKVINDMHDMNENIGETEEYLFGYFPYAYVTGVKSKMKDKILDNHMINKDDKKMMLRYLGENDE